MKMIDSLRNLKRRLCRSLLAEVMEDDVEMLLSQHQFAGRGLDIGGAIGPYARHLGPNELVILDIDAQAPADVLGDAHSLPFQADSFDFIIMTNLLEHLRNPAKAIEEAGRVVKPGGKILVSVPFLFRIHPNPNDYWRFTLDGLSELMDGSFTLLKYRDSGGMWAVIWETLLQIRLLHPLRIMNPLLAKLCYRNSDFPLCISLAVVKK